MIVQIYIVILGLFIGSFLNVVADRLYFGQTLLGRSKCDKCKHVLSWRDLIPIISYYSLKGQCRYCKASISLQYPLVELFTSAVFLLTYNLATRFIVSEIEVGLYLAMSSVFIVLILTDLRYHIFPDLMLYFFIGISLLMKIFDFIEKNLSFLLFLNILGQSIVSGLIVALPLLIVYFVTKRKGMGFGDVILAFGIGFLLGTWSGLIAIYIAFVSGGLLGAFLMLTKKGKPKSMIAFGPFLIIGTYLVKFFEPDIWQVISFIYGI